MSAYPTVKKQCERCNKPFLTKELDKKYCTDVCEKKHQYFLITGRKDKIKQCYRNCKQCGEISPHNSHFCNENCRRLFKKNKRISKNKELFVEDKKKNIKKLPYDVLNKIEEKKRIFDDSWWHYNKNYQRI